MKKIFYISIATLFILSLTIKIYSQSIDIPDYAFKKAEFWKEYQVYKEKLKVNPSIQKPIDRNGIFYIDENGNFNTQPTGSSLRWNNFSAPRPIGNIKDAVSAYTFSQSTTTYTPAYGGTMLCVAGCDDQTYNVTIPFSFTYNGTSYTAISINNNGWFSMGTTTTTGNYSPICNGTVANAIAVFSQDLYGNNGTYLDTLRYLTTGSSPNRVFTIEWSKWGFYSSAYNEISFEAKLFEGTNVIQFVYKPETPTTTNSSIQVGLMGATNADFNTRTTTTNWSATTSGVACSYLTFSPTVYPASGLTFSWTPAAPSATPTVSTTTPVVTGPNTAYTGGTVSDSGASAVTARGVCWSTALNPTVADSHTVNGTGIGVFTSNCYGLTPNTLYHVRAYATNLNGTSYGSDLTFTTCAAGSQGIPYTEGFEGVTTAGTWPCGMTYSGAVTTYIAAAGSYNRFARTGNCYASFQYGSGGKWVFTQGVYLTAGVTYNFATWYITDGYSGWTSLTGYYGLAPNAAAMTTAIPGATVSSPINTTYAKLGGSFTPTVSGVYYIGIYEVDTGAPWYLTIDDISLSIPTPMIYTSSTTAQISNGLNATQNSINNAIIQVQVVMTGSLTPLNLTSMVFNTTGTTNPTADISTAKVYYTGSSSVFSTSTLFGSTNGPNGTFTISGTQTLVEDVNYFWLTYDIPTTGPVGDFLDAQCTSMIGSGSMGTQIPAITNPAGKRQIDNYCRPTYSTNSLPYGIYLTNVTIGTLSNPSGYDPDNNFPYAYSWYAGTPVNVEQGVTYPVSATVNSSTNPQGVGVWVDWDNSNTFEPGEFTAFPLILSNGPTTVSTNIIVPANAPLGNHRVRLRTTLSSITNAQPCTALTYGETEDYAINVTTSSSMVYSSSTATQGNTTTVTKPATNAEIMGIQIVTTGSTTPLNATSFTLNTNGSTSASNDISKARLFYTGTNSSFAATSQFGGAVNAPNGTFTITGSQQLQPGINYFWLAYDIPSSATTSDVVDAECTSLTVGIARIPSITAPTGSRTIGADKMAGVYNIPGDYPHFNLAISDLNARGTSGPVTFNVAAGFVDTAVSLILSTPGSASSPIIFQRVGADVPLPNPVIVAGTGVGSMDAIIFLNGADFITFDGIDLQENPANTTTTTQMEWGYALVKPNSSSGCQNNTIKNCNITLNKTNTTSVGIYSANHSTTSTGTFAITSTAGANTSNTFFNNVITNTYIGIAIYGYSDAAPYSFYDQNNTINQCSITNYGGSSVTAYGIYDIYQNGLTITNCTINSAGGTNSTGTLYGIFCSTMINSNLTVSNNTITIAGGATTSSIYGLAYGNSSAGTTNNINILNNSIQNCTYTTATSGAMYGIYGIASANNLVISGNKLIGNTYGSALTSTGTSIYGIYNGSSSVNSITITNNLDSGNIVYGTTSYSIYRLYNSVSVNNAIITGNKIKNNTLCGTTAAGTTYGIYNGAGTFTCNMSNNEISNNSLPTTSSQSMYFLYNTSAAPTMDYSSNLVTGNTGTGSGTFYSLYYSASPGVGSTVNVTNNTITNQTKTTTTGTGAIYGLYALGSPAGNYNINGNTVTGFSSAAATTMYGIYHSGSPANYLFVNNNKVGNLTTGGASTIYGIYVFPTSTTIVTVAQDSIFNLTSLGGTIYGLYNYYGNPSYVYGNKISGLYSTTGTAGVVYGMYISSGTLQNVYNNVISELNTPASTSIAPAIAGIYVSTPTYTNLYYNTIYLNAASTGASFGTAGIYASTTYTLDMRNNLVINNSTPGSTSGQTVAYRRSSTTLTTYSATSNNNCFYAGTPAANRLIYYDGTNSDQTLAAFKTRLINRDQNSITENPPFVNSSSVPYDLRIQTGTATGLESGGQIISTPLAPVSITADGFGVPRYPNSGYPVGGFTPTAPDIGANEFGGLRADNSGPTITYTPLGIGGVAASRAFNNVIITDPQGINTTAGTKPRVYYKRSTDGNVINDNTNTTDGWKYAEANGTTSPFDFTIDYTKLNGGTGVLSGQIIQYFVIAQDLDATPEVGANQATFTTAPTTVALISGNAPITNTLQYTINTNSFAGSYNVGTAQTYTNLTGAAGIFAAINAGTVTGDITINITSDLTEDGVNQLNALNETGVGGYKVKIVPADGTLKTISGAVANGMIRLNGVRRVTIDGNYSGSGKYLTFRNTNGANPTLTFINDAVRDTIKNCNIESNNLGTASGTILFSTTTGLQGNDSNVIANCDIRDRSDIAGNPANAIYSSGTTTTLGQYNNYNSISNCNIYNYHYDIGSFTAGIYLSTGNTSWTISGNSFYQTASRSAINASSFIGVLSNSTLQNDINVTNNYFGGSAPLCGGTPMLYSGAGAYSVYAFYLSVGNLAASSVQGNTVQNIDLTTSPAASSSAFFKAVYAAAGWVNIGNLSGNTIGSGTGNSSISLTTNTSTASYSPIAMIQHGGFGSIMNNTIGSITFAGNSIGTADLYAAIYWSASIPGQVFTISNNLIGSLTTANSIQSTNLVDGHSMRGMYLLNGAGTQNNVTNNIVANMTSLNTTINLCSVYGIQVNSAVNANYTFTGNTVRNLINNCNPLTASFGILGISSPGLGTNIFSQNTIYSLYANGTGAGAQIVGGILAGGASTVALGGTISRNKIYDIRINGTGFLAPSPLILGINVQGNAPYNVTNNMVSLTNGDGTELPGKLTNNEKFEQVKVENPDVNLSAIQEQKEELATNSKYIPDLSIKTIGLGESSWINIPKPVDKGRQDNINSTVNTAIAGVYHTNSSYGPSTYYYNSIYIGGTQPSGSYSSWAIVRTSTGAIQLINNLLVNARTGGYANQYVIGNEAGNPAYGWPANTSNYNVFVGTNAAAIGEWGPGTPMSITQWISSSGADKQSYSTVTGSINVTNLFTDITNCNLNLQTSNIEAWISSGKGIAIAGQNVDFDGNTRVTSITNGCTDIGADEFTATPPSNPTAVQSGTPAPGAVSDYYIYGRKICSIEWGLGGTSYPTGMNVNYYSGVNPSNTGSLGAAFSNSYTTIAPTSGTLNGSTYNITYYFGDNETYTIPSPSINTVLAKYDGFWQTFANGNGSGQSNLDWSNLTLKVIDLDRFSTFILADGSMAVKLIYPANRQYYIPAAPTFVWNKVTGATNYKFELSTDSTFASAIVTDSTLTDSTRLVSGLTLNTAYFWRVRAKNGTIIGPTSSVYKFGTGNQPVAPTLVSPLNNSVGQSLTPLLDWTDITDLTNKVNLTALGLRDDPQAITYQVQLSASSNFGSNIIDSNGLSTSQCQVGAGKLTNFTVYYWRVRATDGISTTPWSTIWNFRTLMTTTTLLTPANGATNVSLTTNMTWTTVTGAANYRIQISTNSGFSSFTKDTITTAAQYSCYSGLLSPAVQYYWRVKPFNGTDSGATSAAWNFTTAGWVTVNLTIVPGGFYNTSTGKLNMKDTIKLYLVDTVGGGHLVDSSRAVIDSSTFTAQFKFDNAPDGWYYIYVFHRNHIPIATANMLNMTRTQAVNYNMSDTATKTFGSNVIQVSTNPPVWGMIPGDANQDQYVDAIDQQIWIAQNGLDGYLSADFNGDIYVDAIDQQIWIAYNGNSSYLPWYPAVVLTDPTGKIKISSEKINSRNNERSTNTVQKTVIINKGTDKTDKNNNQHDSQNNKMRK